MKVSLFVKPMIILFLESQEESIERSSSPGIAERYVEIAEKNLKKRVLKDICLFTAINTPSFTNLKKRVLKVAMRW